MPRLTDALRQERMRQIAEAALRCFARNGFAGTSMADIIAEAGLSAGSIYSHFDSRSELMRFATASVLEERRAALSAATADGRAPGPADILRLMFTGMVHGAAVPVLPQIWAEARHDPELGDLVREKIGQVRALLTDALQAWARAQGGSEDAVSARAEAAADTIMLLFQGLTVRLSIDPTARASELLDRAADVLP